MARGLATILLVSVLAALVRGQTDIYVGDVPATVEVTAGHPAQYMSNPFLGFSYTPGGPYDTNSVLTLYIGQDYIIHNEAMESLVFQTTTVVAGASSAVLTIAGPTTGSAEVEIGAMGNGGGFLVVIDNCVSTAPSIPQLLLPLNGSTISVGDSISWAPVNFGVGCGAGNSNTYTVLLSRNAPLNRTYSFPVQGQNLLDENTLSYMLTDSSITPNTPVGFNTWAIVASNGQMETMSEIFCFGTSAAGQYRSLQTPTPLTNGVAVQGRLYPDLPVGTASVYYSFHVDAMGGTLVITASTSTLDVPNPPVAGNVVLYAGFGGSPTAPNPSAANYLFKSAEAGSSARQSITINNVDHADYVVTVTSPTGTGTYSITAAYYCPSTMYLSQLDKTRCTACPANSIQSTFAAAAPTDCVCQSGYYGPAGGPCNLCPVGGICDGGASPSAVAGYWTSIGDNGQVFYACPLTAACQGGPAGSPLTCRAGYGGPLCANCADNWYKVGGQCFECPASPGVNFAVGIIILLIFLVACFELARFYRRTSAVPVLINFVQTLALLSFFSIDWPQWLRVFYNDCSGFNLNPELTGPECISQGMTFQDKWGSVMAFPLLVLALFLVIFGLALLVKTVLKCVCHVSNGLWRMERIADLLVPSFITFLLFFYISIARFSLNWFDCTPQPDGSFTLDESANILCYSAEWNRLLPAAVLGVFFYGLGIPLGLLIWLFSHHQSLYKSDEHGEQAYQWVGPIYLRYKPHFYWWEILNFLRKALIIIAGLFVSSYPTFQIASTLLILVVSLMIQMLNEPYEYPWTNVLEAWLLFALILLFLAGIMFNSGSVPNRPGMSEFIFAILLIIFIFCLVFAVAVIIKELYDKHKPIEVAQFKKWDERVRSLELEVINPSDHHHRHKRAAPVS